MQILELGNEFYIALLIETRQQKEKHRNNEYSLIFSYLYNTLSNTEQNIKMCCKLTILILAIIKSGIVKTQWVIYCSHPSQHI